MKMKKMICLLAVLIGMASPSMAQHLDSLYAQNLLPAGTPAPALMDHEGRAVSLEQYRGHCVVLDFWATWCPDCRKDVPAMKQLYSEFAPQGVEFVGISFDTNKDVLDKYLQKESIAWRQVSELKKWKETTMSQAYHISWIPSMYLLDTDGKVILGTVEIERLRSKLEELQKAHALVTPAQ